MKAEEEDEDVFTSQATTRAPPVSGSSALRLGNGINQKCDYCLQTAAMNPKGRAEDLLICEDCNAKGENLNLNFYSVYNRTSRDAS